MKVINPATEEIIADLKEDNASSLQQKFDKLKTGQKKWNAVSLKDIFIAVERHNAEDGCELQSESLM